MRNFGVHILHGLMDVAFFSGPVKRFNAYNTNKNSSLFGIRKFGTIINGVEWSRNRESNRDYNDGAKSCDFRGNDLRRLNGLSHDNRA